MSRKNRNKTVLRALCTESEPIQQQVVRSVGHKRATKTTLKPISLHLHGQKNLCLPQESLALPSLTDSGSSVVAGNLHKVVSGSILRPMSSLNKGERCYSMFRF